MKSALYAGTISHTRYIPKVHGFSYPFFMYYLDLEEMEKGVHFGKWFSSMRSALSRFKREDYLGNADTPLAEAVKQKMLQLTGKKVEGKVFGLMNMRTLGLYFSPVNFYYGFDQQEKPSHFLAEVSNTPWNERHCYAHILHGSNNRPTNPKEFKVSPFNPERNQQYIWQIGIPEKEISIMLGVHDDRGHVFEAKLHLKENPFTLKTVKRYLRTTPAMTISIISKIYWQALKLYLKGIPFIP